MIKSVAGKYRDVVYMTPINAISAEKLHKIWKNVVINLVELGFDVVTTMTDGASANVKFPREKLYQEETDIQWVKNPTIPNNQIFMLFDTVHLFNFFYNNFLRKETFICP